MATSKDLRHLILPYCLQQQKDGRYIALNRNYKPIGFTSNDWVTYENYPIAFTTKITPIIAARISHNSSPNTETIYLYADNCIPTDSKQNWDAYSVKLEILSGLKIDKDA